MIELKKGENSVKAESDWILEDDILAQLEIES